MTWKMITALIAASTWFFTALGTADAQPGSNCYSLDANASADDCTENENEWSKEQQAIEEFYGLGEPGFGLCARANLCPRDQDQCKDGVILLWEMAYDSCNRRYGRLDPERYVCRERAANDRNDRLRECEREFPN